MIFYNVEQQHKLLFEATVSLTSKRCLLLHFAIRTFEQKAHTESEQIMNENDNGSFLPERNGANQKILRQLTKYLTKLSINVMLLREEVKVKKKIETP